MEQAALYEIKNLRREGELIVGEVHLNASHKIFEGHFPEMPVLPGVCMLQIIKDCAAAMAGKELRIDYIKNCKFVSVVNPRENDWLTVSLLLTDGNNLQATLSAGENTALKLKASYLLLQN